MKNYNRFAYKIYKNLVPFIAISYVILVTSCSTIDPNKVDVKLEKTAPKAKVTSYTEALGNLGLMTEIYASEMMKIQSNPIGDRTGTSGSTGGEIPRDITEMLKSSLNSIGGNVIYIPYDPAFMQNQMVTGYSKFENKILPDVILSGGITEFDRGLETRGTNTDVSAGAEFGGLYDWLPNKETKIKYGISGKAGMARITLDFNLLDFSTMTGIAKMNVVNTMEVRKALKGKEMAVSFFGQAFGRKGSIKRVQGRHAAVRLLVELSMIQMVGKYNAIPYWNLLGDGAEPDKEVIRAIKKFYYSLGSVDAIAVAKEWLFLHGYDVSLDGSLDETAISAFKQFDSSFTPEENKISEDMFLKIYNTIPINESTLGRRNQLAALREEQALAMQSAEAVSQQEAVQVDNSGVAEDASAATQEPMQEQEQVQPQQPTISKRNRSIGKFLTDDEW